MTTHSEHAATEPAGGQAGSSTSAAGLSSGGPPRNAAPPDPRRWKTLAVLGFIQFMLVLDVTVVNIALPSIQNDLKFSDAGLPWVVNAYVIVAGGLLLFGGRLADIFGRRRLFLIGVVIFAVASVVCGTATNSAVLVIGRFLQGAGEACAAPAALGMVALLFTDPAERGKAFALWGGLAGLGGVTGTVISGVLVDLASWRWIFFINVPVALVALVLIPRLTEESRMKREYDHLDFTGAIAGTVGLLAVVYGLLQVVPNSWGSWRVLVPVLGGLLLLVGMFVWEGRSATPLIPRSFFSNRTRLVANVSTLISTAGFFTYAFLLTLFEQQVLDYSPIASGLSYLPFGLSIGIGIGINNALMPRLGVRKVLAIGFFGSAVGLFLTGMIDPSTSYLSGVLPGMIVLGLSTGIAIPASASAALHDVDMQNSSLASAVQNVMQQVGAAIGIACLAALAFSHSADRLNSGASPAEAVTSGYALSFQVGAGLMLLSAVLVLILLGSPKPADWSGSGAPQPAPDRTEPAGA
jgi:EmrB/QacA subfamily drug resistance transporter